VSPRWAIAWSALALLLAGYLATMPVTGNLLRYILWSSTFAPTAVDGHIETRDAQIHYRSYGTGPPILLLHGGLSNCLSWFSQIPWLVEAGRRVILVDTRGHGGSWLGRSELSYRLFAADAVQVLDHLGIRRADVAGWSDGGNTALLLARYWPQRVGRIVTISANYDPSGLTPQALAGTRSYSSGLALWLHRLWTGAGEHTAELERRLKHLWRTAPELTAGDLRAVQAPTLVIVGSRDVIRIEHAREMSELLPHGELLVVEGGGHSLPVTCADLIDRSIANFLGFSALPIKP
jgi:pimeloyl-ACP methyl ester carboxylesterase